MQEGIGRGRLIRLFYPGGVERKDAVSIENRAFPVRIVILFCPSITVQEYNSLGKKNVFPALRAYPCCHTIPLSG